ncbi:MAG: hypothetical protein Q9220_004352 [cf. Caloplaca sp. 1 TL-2023]
MASLESFDFDLSAFGNFPALLPPPGVHPNFIDPYSRGRDVVIASSICVGLMMSMVIMRFYTKIRIKRVWGWDDLVEPFIKSVQIGAIGFAAVAIDCKKIYISVEDYQLTRLLVANQAVGPHQWNVPVSHLTPNVLRVSHKATSCLGPES